MLSKQEIIRQQGWNIHYADQAKELLDNSNCNRRQLYRYLRFYRFYPQIAGALSPKFEKNLPQNFFDQKEGKASEEYLGCIGKKELII